MDGAALDNVQAAAASILLRGIGSPVVTLPARAWIKLVADAPAATRSGGRGLAFPARIVLLRAAAHEAAQRSCGLYIVLYRATSSVFAKYFCAAFHMREKQQKPPPETVLLFC